LRREARRFWRQLGGELIRRGLLTELSVIPLAPLCAMLAIYEGLANDLRRNPPRFGDELLFHALDLRAELEEFLDQFGLDGKHWIAENLPALPD